MTQITEAIFTNGMLKPQGELSLREHERVRIIVETLEPASGPERARAVEAMRSGIAGMKFKSNGAYPSRDELHERR